MDQRGLPDICTGAAARVRDQVPGVRHIPPTVWFFWQFSQSNIDVEEVARAGGTTRAIVTHVATLTAKADRSVLLPAMLSLLFLQRPCNSRSTKTSGTYPQ